MLGLRWAKISSRLLCVYFTFFVDILVHKYDFKIAHDERFLARAPS